ncbi:MAG: hypothetical protein PHU07_12535 [Acidocella sp.]|nr:hypothetical protein [Acidocella sp.]
MHSPILGCSKNYFYGNLIGGKLHIFMDESGTFSGGDANSISVVGGLAIPDGKLDVIRKKYAKIRKALPLDKGEVKGRALNEKQINDVVTMLTRNEVIYEATVTDRGLYSESDVIAFKNKHADAVTNRLDLFAEPDRTEVRAAIEEMRKTSIPLYIQALLTFETLQSLINNIPSYFSQRRPQELGQFVWVVDGKDRRKETKWETWWSWYACGALPNMSKHCPAPSFEKGDYSYFNKFRRVDGNDVGVDVRLLMSNLTFSSDVTPELELIDIVTTATRRALKGSLQASGWEGLSKLMIHRVGEPYLRFISLEQAHTPKHEAYTDIRRRVDYGEIINKQFSTGGKLMLAPQFRLPPP